ncbi:MAG: CBS domain-containing protein [Dehalococcoidia bacterium]
MDGTSYLDDIKRQLEAGARVWRRGDKVLGAFGYTRRRQSAVDLINSELDKRQLRAAPPISKEMALDTNVTFTLKGQRAGRGQTPVTPPEQEGADEPTTTEASDPADRAVVVGNLKAAERKPDEINPEATVAEALTRMDILNTPVLVVTTTPTSVKGTISYRAVARAQLHGTPTKVADCLDETTPQVTAGTPLFQVIESFAKHEAVIVIGVNRQVAGMVTPVDVANEFSSIAGPFLLIGEIEEHLRALLKSIDLATALTVAPSTDTRQASNLSDLTIGEMERILERPEHWNSVGTDSTSEHSAKSWILSACSGTESCILVNPPNQVSDSASNGSRV